MPELPEVETVMRGLAHRLEGRRIATAAVNRADLRRAIPPGLARRLTGARVVSFRRRAKYILMRLEGGDTVLLHLGMSGRIVLSGPGANTPPEKHEHMVLESEEGWRVGFVDPRRFGALDLMRTDEEDAHPLLAGLGPEPLEAGFDGAVLARAMAGRHTPVKSALLDQHVVAGIGNIYACEALFRAGISPWRSAHSVGRQRAARLAAAVQATLTEAVAAGGSSLRDYVQPSGELGYFQHAWKVYGREGEACERCAEEPGCLGIRRVAQAGRSTFYCPRTQR